MAPSTAPCLLMTSSCSDVRSCTPNWLLDMGRQAGFVCWAARMSQITAQARRAVQQVLAVRVVVQRQQLRPAHRSTARKAAHNTALPCVCDATHPASLVCQGDG